jgi:hypothetical protein
VGEPDPKQAILEHLARKPDVPPPRFGREARRPPLREGLRLLRDRLRGRHQFLVMFGRVTGYGADPAKVRFVKERGIPGRRLYAVEFEDQWSQPWHWLVAAQQSEAGEWSVGEVAGGGGGWGQSEPRPRRPWLNFCGSWGADGFYGGGAVHTAGADVSRVRLRFRDGLVLEDDVDSGVALFATDRQIQAPVRVELTDRGGTVIAIHMELERHSELEP